MIRKQLMTAYICEWCNAYTAEDLNYVQRLAPDVSWFICDECYRMMVEADGGVYDNA